MVGRLRIVGRRRARRWRGAVPSELIAGPARADHQKNVGAALRAAVAAGWSNASPVAHDPDLAPLRDRDDFRRLLAELFDRTMPADPFAP